MRLLTAIVLGCVLASGLQPAAAQTNDEDALYAHIGQHFRAGEYAKAIPYAERYVELMTKRYGNAHPRLAGALNNLALLYDRQGRASESEPLYLRSLAIKEKTLAPNDPSLATAYNNMGSLYERQGRFAEAEPLYKRSLAVTEKAAGPDHQSVATVLNNLAGLYAIQGRYDDAVSLHKRALSIKEKTLGGDHPSVGTSYNNLATLYDRQRLYKAAEPLYKRALEIWEKVLGPEHIHIASALGNLAGVYINQSQFADAEPLQVRALAIVKKSLGSAHPLVATFYNNLGSLKERQGQYAEAKRLYKSSLAIMEKALGSDHPHVARILDSLGMLNAGLGEWQKAYERVHSASAITAARSLNGLDRYRDSQGGAAQRSRYFRDEVAVAWRLAEAKPERRKALLDTTFQAAQWSGRTVTATALGQMAARSRSRDPRLSGLVREQQDLSREWQVQDKKLVQAISMPAAQRNQNAIDALRSRVITIDNKLQTLGKRLENDFPAYAALANPKPLDIADVRKHLGPDEALIVYLVNATDSYVWAVTREKSVWKTIPRKQSEIEQGINDLRQSLDPIAALQSGSRGFTRVEACRGLSRLNKPCEAYDTDLERAHKLYVDLLGPVAKVVEHKRHLILVPSGPLTGLPFHMLLTASPPALRSQEERLRQASWLIRRHAVSVLPSVSSLSALRSVERKAKAERPFIGFGNPEFFKPKSRPQKRKTIQTVQTTRGYATYFRGKLADVDALSGNIAPLPDTALELAAVAKVLKAPKSDIVLGRRASESVIKSLSKDGRLDDYRIVHFATHGLIAGELEGLGEPALALSLPDKATAQDDGLLTASEVAELKLNADWVVLSACNTAAGSKPGAEAFSGLARAFFYAGTRALLVSHWPVVSEAAVKLTTQAFTAMQLEPEIGRAEALRRSMLALIDKGTPSQRHPSYWAPFVVVGEGAR